MLTARPSARRRVGGSSAMPSVPASHSAPRSTSGRPRPPSARRCRRPPTTWNRATRRAAGSSHHSSSTGQGPAQASTAIGARAVGADRSGGGRDTRPRATDRHRRRLVRRNTAAGTRLGEHPGRRRRRDAARPGQLGGCGAARPARPTDSAAGGRAGCGRPGARVRAPASGPSIPCSRATPRSTSARPGALPHSPSPWSASDSTDLRDRAAPSQTGSGAGSPCSCQ